jgi:Tol biopolymer transport system component
MFTLAIPVTAPVPVAAVSTTSPNPLQVANTDQAVITPKGRFVAFVSSNSDVVPGIADTAGYKNVYVLDRATNAVTLVSADFAGTSAGDADSDAPTISANGQYVAFESDADDLAAPGLVRTNATNIFVRNLLTGTTQLVSSTPAGTASLEGTALSPMISADGRFVVFQSNAPDLLPTVSGGPADPFVHDLAAGTTRLASTDASGTPLTGFTDPLAISGNGQYFLYLKSDSLDGSATASIFTQDLLTGATTRVTSQADDSVSARLAGETVYAAISDNGQFVAFNSVATGLVPGIQDGTVSGEYGENVYVTDVQTGTTQLASVFGGQSTGSGPSFLDAIIRELPSARTPDRQSGRAAGRESRRPFRRVLERGDQPRCRRRSVLRPLCPRPANRPDDTLEQFQRRRPHARLQRHRSVRLHERASPGTRSAGRQSDRQCLRLQRTDRHVHPGQCHAPGNRRQ